MAKPPQLRLIALVCGHPRDDSGWIFWHRCSPEHGARAGNLVATGYSASESARAQQVVRCDDFENGQPLTSLSCIRLVDTRYGSVAAYVDRQGRVLPGVGRYRASPMPPVLVVAKAQSSIRLTSLPQSDRLITHEQRATISSFTLDNDDDHFTGSRAGEDLMRTNVAS